MSEEGFRDLTIKMGIREVLSQAQYAEVAFRNIQVKGIESTVVAFSSIHSFLTHSAMISKLLWSQDLSNNSISKPLVDILDIPANISIKEREFRNILEHYDERLKQWVDEKGPNVNILDNNIGPKNAIKINNAIWVRHYDPGTSIFTLLDRDLNLGELYDEVKIVKAKASEWLNSRLSRDKLNSSVK